MFTVNHAFTISLSLQNCAPKSFNLLNAKHYIKTSYLGQPNTPEVDTNALQNGLNGASGCSVEQWNVGTDPNCKYPMYTCYEVTSTLGVENQVTGPVGQCFVTWWMVLIIVLIVLIIIAVIVAVIVVCCCKCCKCI